MTRNIHKIGYEARDLAFKGADIVAEAVEKSMGPAGSNLLIEKGNTTTNDGMKISQFLSASIENEFERRGALYQHQGSVKVEQLVKDSTSAYFSLSRGIRKAILPFLPTTKIPIGTPVSELRKKLGKEFKQVSEMLETMSTPISSREELIKSALVSVEDEELAEMIGGMQWDLVQATGQGIIKVQETPEYTSSIERTTGIYMDNGFATSLMINNPEKESLYIENTNILLTNYVIQTLEPLAGLLTDLRRNGKTVLSIFARAFSEDAMKEISQWGQKGMAILPINAPYTNQGSVFQDIAAVTNSNYISNETKDLSEITINDIGFCKKLMCARQESFISGAGDEKEPERVAERVAILEKELQASNSEFYKETLEERIAGLKGAYAILKVGSKTEADRKRKADKCDDAVGAVRNALKGGTVKGAGLAFKEISDSLHNDYILKQPLLGIYNQIINSLPAGTEIPDWCRDPRLSLITALEIAIESSLNLANIHAQDVNKNPKECDCK